MAYAVTKKTDSLYKNTVYKISMTRGDSLIISFELMQDGEAYIPQDGDVIRFALKEKISDESVLVEKIIPNDTMTLTLAPEDTKNLNFGEYRYDVQITYADGFVYTFITDSPFEITNEVE